MDDDPNGSCRIRGQNDCAAFSNTDSPVLDLFFKVTPKTKKEVLERRLDTAWKEEAEMTLKVIFNLGNLRKGGGGKQETV